MTAARFAFAGGGSGGDAYPLLAVAGAISERCPEAEHLFFATHRDLGADIYRRAGMQVVEVVARRFLLREVPFLPFTLARGLMSARDRLSAFRPGLLLAIGGFVSPPVVLAASSLGIPVFLLEANSVAGRANRILAHFAEAILTAYPGAARTLPDPGRVECLGLPLRFRADEERRAALRSARPANQICVAVTGGSLGARVLNRALQELYPEIACRPGLRVVHVTGRANEAEARACWEAAGRPSNLDLRGYEEDMERLFLEADAVVCRAGATTCHELATFRVPALVVPLAMAPHDHQYWNALPLAEAGAVEIVREEAFGTGLLRERLDAWLAAPGALEERRRAFGDALRPGAAGRVAERLLVRLGVENRAPVESPTRTEGGGLR